MLRVLSCLALLIAISAMSLHTKEADADLVPALDGYYNFSSDFKMYSGYLQIQANPLINVHYIFATSMRDPAKDDLVLWLNGGPGCSSLLGFAQELGPCSLNQGSQDFSNFRNPYSWNNQANMLFFETPPGVGFSVNNDPNYIFNQSRTALDGVSAIQQFFLRFPEMKGNNFWVSGESYCGMYIPFLATALIEAKISLKGMLIGNGVMYTEGHWRTQARNLFYSRHYFYGSGINQLLESCKYTDIDLKSPSCTVGQQLAYAAVKGVNPYSSTGICYERKNKKRFWYSAFDKEMFSLKDSSGCSSDDSGITAYFNRPNVQKQLHINGEVNWQSCNDNIGLNYQKELSAIPLFEDFKKRGLKILLYSGNTDAQVSYLETEEYIRRIGWRAISEKKPWVNARKSLMGWTTKYDGLTFAVVNGAGHMVPSDKPHAAWQMFNSFIYDA